VALDIRYARSGGVSIAYQVVGGGDVDLVYVPDYVSNLVYAWETPYWRGFYDRLAERFRLILFDKRGTGLSDLGGSFPALETRVDDVRAVLDAVGSSTACCSARTTAARWRRSTQRPIPSAPGRSCCFTPLLTTRKLRPTRLVKTWRASATRGGRKSLPTRSSRKDLRSLPTTTRTGSGSQTGSASAQARPSPMP